MFKFSNLLIGLPLLLLLGCSKNSGSSSYVSVKGLSFSEKNCNAPYKTVSTDSILPYIRPTPDESSHRVVIEVNFVQNDKSRYRFSDHCFQNNTTNCMGVSQASYQPSQSGHKPFFSVTGQLAIIDQAISPRFDDLTFESILNGKVKTENKRTLSVESIFNPANKKQSASLSGSILSEELKPGLTFLALIDDHGQGATFQLYKMQIIKVNTNETIELDYQKIAQAPTDSYRNFYCSKNAEIKALREETNSGETILFSNRYGGNLMSSFGLDYGVNAYDGRFVHSDNLLRFFDLIPCSGNETLMCIPVSIGSYVKSVTTIVEMNGTTLEAVDETSWPADYAAKFFKQSEILKPYTTYLVGEETGFIQTFGAIRIEEIDPNGNWFKLKWKRVKSGFTPVSPN